MVYKNICCIKIYTDLNIFIAYNKLIVSKFYLVSIEIFMFKVNLLSIKIYSFYAKNMCWLKVADL